MFLILVSESNMSQARCACLHYGATHNVAVVCRRDMNTSCWFHSLQLIFASVHLIPWTNLVTVIMTMVIGRSCAVVSNLVKNIAKPDKDWLLSNTQGKVPTRRVARAISRAFFSSLSSSSRHTLTRTRSRKSNARQKKRKTRSRLSATEKFAHKLDEAKETLRDLSAKAEETLRDLSAKAEETLRHGVH